MRASLAWTPEMAQVCQRHQRGVHAATEEANDTKLRLIET
jgi:hypothetical protein